MRFIYLLFPLLMLGACKTQQMTDKTSSEKKTSILKPGACPESGSCDVKIHKNSMMTIMTDDTGATYPEIHTGKNTVVEFSFMRKGPEGTADGNYSETLHFEIPSNTKTLSLQDNGLAEVKMLWGKHCYCKGEAGYYVVNNGKLKVNRTDNELTFDAKFKIDGREQVISHIIRTAKL